MSQRYGMTHTIARAVTLAKFGFTLFPARILCVASPTEMEFSRPRVVRKVIRKAIKLPHVPTWNQSFLQHPTIDWYKGSVRPSKIGCRICRLSPCMGVRLFAMVLSIESHSSNKLSIESTQQSTYSIKSAGATN